MTLRFLLPEKGGGRERGEGEGAGRREGAGGGGPGTGGLEGARRQPGRWEAESERGLGALPPFPGRDAGRGCCAAAGGRAAGLSGESAPLSSESPSLRHEAQHCHFTQRRRGRLANPERSTERAQAVERTRSLLFPSQRRRGDNQPRRWQALCRFRSAAPPPKASGKTRPGACASTEPAPLSSRRSYPGRSPPGLTEGSGKPELYSRLQNWPEPETARPSRPRLDPLAAGLVS